MNVSITARLEKLGARSDVVAWASKFESDQEAWDKCERADWMLWLSAKVSGEKGSIKHRNVVLACCACARESLKLINKEEKRPLQAIELAERYGNGEDVSQEELFSAANAAVYEVYASAYADADAAAYAAYAAAYADATYAAYAAAYADTKTKAHKKMAILIRKIIPNVPEF